MQIETNLQVRSTLPSPATVLGNPAGGDFLAALEAAGRADTAAPETPAVSLVPETDPVELYQTVTGRTAGVIREELPPYCSDRALATFIGGSIDTAKMINWHSKGDRELTAEQIAELKKKYDVENLSRQDYYDLMSDLTRMEVLSGEDCARVHLATAPPPGRYIAPPGYSTFGGRGKFPGGSLADYFSDAVDELLEHLAGFRQLNPCRPEDGLNWLERDIAPRQRMAELLDQLRR